MGTSIVFATFLSRVKPAQECVLFVPFPWSRPGWLCAQRVRALHAWDFSLHSLPLVLQEKVIRGNVLDSLSEGSALLSHGPSSLALV